MICNMYSAIVLFIFIVIQECAAQDIGDSCYGPGSIATAVIVTIIVTVLLICILYAIWKGYLKNKREKHLILETDPERGVDNQYVFDNAGFKDTTTITTPANSTLEKNNKSTDSNKSRWSQWSPLSALILNKNEKQKTLDDSAVQAEQVKTVLLKSHDFTGLGFNIYGNMRDGIFIKDILHRGPASESGMLNAGDRIKSVTINFDHIVYEDALTILSYASPYEVTLEARNGRILTTNHQPVSSNKTVRLGHPVYRSSSSADLTQISYTKKRLFPDESTSPYTTLQKHINTSTLEKKRPQSPSSLKIQLEQKLSPNHHQDHLKQKSTVEIPSEPAELQKTTENKYQKFGIKVLPVELKTNMSPKTIEQNENNINLEKSSIDEVDVKEFVRENSGIKRDKDGIPQEIPNHMLNAAVAAKRNRRAPPETTHSNEEPVKIKSPKRLKGRAPAPPVPEKYASDSENENDSTNTIELNSSDITVHHSEEIIDRKTASTGDLTKIQKPRNGTLERAQSLDITDAGLPNLGKKRISGISDEGFDNSKSDSNDSLYGKELIHKEPRLSLALDGLNTFQRNRLKKSTEWGNLEDAINMNDSNDKIEAVVSRINEIKQENTETSFETYNGTNETDANSEYDDESLNLLPHHILASENFLLNERDASNEDSFYNLNNACDDIKVSLNLEKPEELVSNITVLENKNDELYLTALDTTLVNNDVTIHGPTSLTVGVPEDQTLVSNMIFNISSPSTTKQTTHTYITEIQVSTPTDPEKELHKIHEIAEEQLKLLPEMRFSTSSYESSPPKSPENTPQVDQIRSTFEKTNSRSKTPPRLETKSRIPVPTPGLKTPPTSPERRDSRVYNEVDNEIIALMSSTPINNGRPKTPNKNISVTSIRSSSKIPSGFPGRPPAPPRKYEDGETNGNSSFKQWVFHPSD